MEKESPSKPSVAELAGRLKGHILPMPTANDEPPFRRRPPCSLKLNTQKDNNNEDAQKPLSPPNPLKVRTRNSALIEKLQANLALSPTALLPSPKSPDVKLPPAPLSPTSPQTPQSPVLSPVLSPALSPALRPSQSSEEEDPVSFESPPEGTTLPSLHKTRARLSFKRRPPTRQHRRSAQEEEEEEQPSPTSPKLLSPKENGVSRDQVFERPALEATADTGAQDDRDCETIEEEVRSKNQEESTTASEEQDVEEKKHESEPCPTDSEDTDEKKEEMTEKSAEDNKNE